MDQVIMTEMQSKHTQAAIDARLRSEATYEWGRMPRNRKYNKYIAMAEGPFCNTRPFPGIPMGLQ
jgi:hypothetical protein